jgi:hypothetical protein
MFASALEHELDLVALSDLDLRRDERHSVAARIVISIERPAFLESPPPEKALRMCPSTPPPKPTYPA